MASSKVTVTIIGFGAFGQLVARLLAPYARVSVHDRSAVAMEAASALGFDLVARIEDIRADVVILAVPLRALDEVLRAIAPHLRPGQLVVDVCSVKEEPARLMSDLLPPHAEILACHPMFGPQSAKRGVENSQIVLCPLRAARWRGIARFLERVLKLEVIVTTPEDHDRQVAMTQGLTHLLAQVVASLGDRPAIRTRSFDLIAEGLALVANDAPEVFEAIARGNRHFAPMGERLVSAIRARI